MATQDEIQRRWFDRQKSQQEQPLNGGGGDGTSGDVSSDWKKSVDDQLKRGTDNFRALLQGGIAAALVIVGMIVGLYVFTGNKSEALSSQVSGIKVDIATMRGEANTANAQIVGRLDRIGDRLPPKQ